MPRKATKARRKPASHRYGLSPLPLPPEQPTNDPEVAGARSSASLGEPPTTPMTIANSCSFDGASGDCFFQEVDVDQCIEDCHNGKAYVGSKTAVAGYQEEQMGKEELAEEDDTEQALSEDIFSLMSTVKVGTQ